MLCEAVMSKMDVYFVRWMRKEGSMAGVVRVWKSEIEAGCIDDQRLNPMMT